MTSVRTTAAQQWLAINTSGSPSGEGRTLIDAARAQRDLSENWQLTPQDRLELAASLPADQRKLLLEQLPGWQRSQALGDSAVDVHHLRAHQTGPVYDVKFDVLGPGHTSARAHAMAVLSKRAYESLGLEGTPAVAFKELIAQGWAVKALGSPSTEGMDPAKSTQAFVAVKGDQVIFSARGTEPDRAQDLLVDAQLHKVPTKHGQSHGGFVAAADQVWSQLQAVLTEASAAAGRPLHLHLTGHSLGAAIATEVAMRVNDTLPGKVAVDGVYTFGSPRVYDDQAALAYDRALGGKTYRYANHRDLVSIVPPASLGFAHVGRPYYLDGDGGLQAGFGSKDIARDKLRPLEVLTSTLVNKEPASIWDHGSYPKLAFLVRNDKVDGPKANLAQLMASLAPGALTEAQDPPHTVLTRLSPEERSRVLFDLPKGSAEALVRAVGATDSRDLRAWLQAAPAAVAKHPALAAALAAPPRTELGKPSMTEKGGLVREALQYGLAAAVNGVTGTLNLAVKSASYTVTNYRAPVEGLDFLWRGSRLVDEHRVAELRAADPSLSQHAAEELSEREGMKALKTEGFTAIIGLTSERDFDTAAAKELGLKSLYLPVEDMSTPTHDQMGQYLRFLQQVKNEGGKALVHCEAGQGRTNLFAAAAEMVFAGKTADQVIAELRHHDGKAPGTVDYTPKLRNHRDFMHIFEQVYHSPNRDLNYSNYGFPPPKV
jgi:triacylglycerol lipase